MTILAGRETTRL